MLDEEFCVGEQYHPWREADALGLRIIVRDLPDALWAAWHAPSRTILVDRRLTQAERRVALAHELVHVERRDTCRQTERVELDVHLTAARRLIRLDDLADALVWTRQLRELADELWVDDTTLRQRLDSLTAEEVAWLRRRLNDIEGAA